MIQTKRKRKITVADECRVVDFLHSIGVSPVTGISQLGWHKGNLVPKPLQTTHRINLDRLGLLNHKLTSMTQKWAKNAITNQEPVYIYGDVMHGELLFCIDFDNIKNLPVSDFALICYKFIEIIKLSGLYIQPSTHGKGFHSYGFLIIDQDLLYNHDRHEIDKAVIALFSKLRKVVEKIIHDNNWQTVLHIDILGQPDLHYEADRRIHKRGMPMKFPYEILRNENEMEKFSHAIRVTAEHECFKELTVEKKQEIKAKKKLKPTNNSSVKTPHRFADREKIEKWFRYMYGCKVHRINKNLVFTDNEFADYVISIIFGLDMNKRSRKETYGREQAKGIWSYCEDEGLLSTFKRFNNKKWKYVVELLVSYGVISWINPNWKATLVKEDGEIVEGVCRKADFCEVQYERLFISSTAKTSLSIRESKNSVKGKCLRFEAQIPVNKSKILSDWQNYLLDPGDYGMTG